MTALTRGYLTTEQEPSYLIDQTPVHDKLQRDLLEAEVEKAREKLEASKAEPDSQLDDVLRVGVHRRPRRWHK